MVSFKVLSRVKAKKESYTISVPTIIISIADINLNNNVFAQNPNIKDVLRLKFDDESGGDANEMTVEQAKQVVEFVRRWEGRIGQIIVHCEAGISRSSGTAAAIMKYMTNDDMPVFENPKYTPNMTCYRKVLEAFYGTTIDESELIEKEKISIEAWRPQNDL